MWVEQGRRDQPRDNKERARNEKGLPEGWMLTGRKLPELCRVGEGSEKEQDVAITLPISTARHREE